MSSEHILFWCDVRPASPGWGIYILWGWDLVVGDTIQRWFDTILSACMIYYQYQTILNLSSPSQRKLNSKMHSWSVWKYFQRMLFFLAYVTVSYIAANKCATWGQYHIQIETIDELKRVNVIFKSRRSVNFKGKDCISDVWYNLAGTDGLFGCMDYSCKWRVHYLHRSFVIVHIECDQWQASFTQEKSACFTKFSVTKQILPPCTRAREQGLALY